MGPFDSPRTPVQSLIGMEVRVLSLDGVATDGRDLTDRYGGLFKGTLLEVSPVGVLIKMKEGSGEKLVFASSATLVLEPENDR